MHFYDNITKDLSVFRELFLKDFHLSQFSQCGKQYNVI